MTFLSLFLSCVRRWQLLALLFTLPFAANAGETRAWVLLMQNPDAAQSIISISGQEKNQLIQAGWKLSGVGTISTEDGANKTMLHRMLCLEPEIGHHVATSPRNSRPISQKGLFPKEHWALR